MIVQPLLVRKLKILGLVCIFTAIVGIIFQRISDGFIGSAGLIVGLFLGLGFGILELFMLKKLNLRLKKIPFHFSALIKALLYTTIILFVSNLLGLIYGYFEGKTLAEFYASLITTDRVSEIVVALVMYSIILLFIQIGRLLGDGVMLRVLSGKYHKPVEEERIFMFLDLKSSTMIAEKLGHEKFYSFLNTFFHEISDPVLMTKAEIYQYVGDEVVFTWKTKDGLENANCLKIFFLIKRSVEDNREKYISEYGMIPEFKAGVHFGKVIVGQIGDLKREIVFNGDVLNTTSRIQELCNTYNQDLLISRRLLYRLKLPEDYNQTYLGEVKIRGKEIELVIYGITQKTKRT